MRKLPTSQKMTLDGPAGDLEALLETPSSGQCVGSVVVCHPHPVHGGTMQNKVTHTLARSFVGLGHRALRFNFRGVNESAGTFDEGRGELQDVLTAVRWLQHHHADSELWLAGFSFGAAMAVRAAVDCQPAGLVSVAPAISRFSDDLLKLPECPWLIVHGDQDELVDIEETISWVNEIPPGPELRVFADTSHFFHGKLILLREAVEEFVKSKS